MPYTCEVCGSTFAKLSQLQQHRRTLNHHPKYTCITCKKNFTRQSNLERHMKKHNDENNHVCPDCLRVFTRWDALEDHFQKHHTQTGGASLKRHSVDDESHDRNSKKAKLEIGENPSNFYDIEKISERKIEKFKTKASYYKISFHELEVKGLSSILRTLKSIFQSILDNMTQEVSTTDLVRISLDNPELDFPIVLPFMRRSALTVERLLSEIERVLQSYEQFVLDETLGIELVHVHMPAGSGYKRNQYVDLTKLLKQKGSVIQINNKDEICCARAITTAIARIEKHPQWNYIRQGRHIQRQLAENLHTRAGVPLRKCSIEDVKTFQSVLPDYQIHILSKDHFNSIVFEGPKGGIPVYLYYHDEHFDVITTITGFLNRCYFCLKCKKGYNTKELHSCNEPCIYCHHLHDDGEPEDWKYCDKCNRYFKNEICFNYHANKLNSGKSTCQTYFKCKDCDQTVNMKKHKKRHQCHEKYCFTCKDFYGESHKCYMQQVVEEELTGPSKKNKDINYVFIDLECTQENKLECERGYLPGINQKCSNCKKSRCGAYEHRPNLAIAHKVCSNCINSCITSDTVCNSCGKNEHIFKGLNAAPDLCKWLFCGENNGATVICHNFKGYDSYPILKYLHDNAILPEVITTGSKYMSIKVPACKIRFIDSLNFIPMALADMPAAFGESELAKGYFPHFFTF